MKKTRSKKHILVFGTILILGLGLRLINIDWGIDKGLGNWSSYPDEPYGYESAFNFKPFSGEFSVGMWSLQKGTFYYETIGTLNEFLEIIGVKQAIFPEFQPGAPNSAYYNYLTGRFITILFSLLIIVAIYYACILLFKNKNIGLLAAFSYSIFAHEIPFSTLITGDVLVTLLSFATLYFAILGYQKKDNSKLVIAAAFCGLTLGTKYSIFPIVLPVAMSFLLIHRKQKATVIVKDAAMLVFAGLLALMIAVPSVFFDTENFLKGMELQKQYQTGEFLSGENQLPQAIFYFSNVIHHGLGLIFTVLILAGFVYFSAKNYKRKETWIVFSYLIPYYIVISTASWITTRYTLPMMPLFAVFIGYFLIDFHKNFKYKKIFVVLAVLCYIYNGLFLYNFLDAIKQPLVHEQFEDFRKQNLKLPIGKPEISFVVSYLDQFTYPVKLFYDAVVIFLKDIQNNPHLDIPTKYLLVSSHNIRDYKRINNSAMVAFLDRLEKSDEFKLIKIFGKNSKLGALFGHDNYYSCDLEVFFQKFYLYEKTATKS